MPKTHIHVVSVVIKQPSRFNCKTTWLLYYHRNDVHGHLITTGTSCIHMFLAFKGLMFNKYIFLPTSSLADIQLHITMVVYNKTDIGTYTYNDCLLKTGMAVNVEYII